MSTKSTAPKLYVSAAEISKAIKSIAGRGAKLDGDIQLAGLSVLQHAEKHGDFTLAENLVEALPKGSRKLALVEWMLAFSQIAKLDKGVAGDAERIAKGGIFKLDRKKTTDLTGAQAKPWHEFKKEASPLTAFDAQAAVKGVLAKLTAAGKAGLTVEHRAEAVAEAETLLRILRGETLEPAVSR